MAKDEKITGYELSRNWFDWCFENPELINPNHTALYFFCIEHCNRMGWKDKFGLPTTMAKDAIGIKSYNTYIKTLNDLINFGFILLIEKSRNQYSSNIIALSKIDKATVKALDKAMIKHTTKQRESKCSILKHITTKQDKPITEPPKSWRNDYEIYLSELRIVYGELCENKEWVIQQEKYHPKVDILLTLEKACVNYWSTPSGWKKKKASKSISIDWKSTLTNALDMNKVYKS